MEHASPRFAKLHEHLCTSSCKLSHLRVVATADMMAAAAAPGIHLPAGGSEARAGQAAALASVLVPQGAHRTVAGKAVACHTVVLCQTPRRLDAADVLRRRCGNLSLRCMRCPAPAAAVAAAAALAVRFDH